MEEKAKVIIELDKSTVQAAAYLAGTQLSDELWERIISEPVPFPMEEMEEQRKEMELGMAMVTIGAGLKRMEESK